MAYFTERQRLQGKDTSHSLPGGLSPLELLRRLLFGTLALSLVGTEAELLLLGHFEDWTQYLPLVILALAIVAQLWHLLSASAATVRVIQGLMWLCVGSGAVGVFLHFRGNVEFELEVTPSMAGLELLKAAATGATPALAPGAMVQIGLIGLAWSLRHPLLRSSTKS